jgi:hypothetical protein
LALGLLLGIAGCAGSPAVQFYTLTPLAPPPAVLSAADMTVALGPIAFPDILDRPQIATRHDDHRVEFSEYHHWAGRLKEDFRRVLVEDLGRLLAGDRVAVTGDELAPEPNLRLALQVIQFDGRPGDAVLLSSAWALRDPKTHQTLVLRKSMIREPLPAAGYAERAAAHSRALAELSREIAAEIRRRHRP